MRFVWLTVLALPVLCEPVTLTLEQAEARAMSSHPRLRAAGLRAEAAEAQPGIVKATGLSPVVSVQMTGSAADHGSRIGAGALNAPDAFSRIGMGLALSQVVTDFGRTSQLVESAKETAAARRSDQAAVTAQVRLRVRRAYYNAMRAQAALDVFDQTVTARQLLVRQIRALAEGSLRSTVDVSFAEVNLADAELARERTQNAYRAALVELANSMGAEQPEEYRLVATGGSDTGLTALEDLVTEAIRNRPELASLRHTQNAALRQAESERRQNLPLLSAQGVVGAVPVGDARLKSTYSGAALNVAIPVWNGRIFQARRAEAELRAAATEAELHEVALAVQGRVRQAWIEADNARRTIPVTQRLFDHAARALRLSEERYRNGLGTIVEVSQAELSRNQAALTQAGALYEFRTRLAELEYEVGR